MQSIPKFRVDDSPRGLEETLQSVAVKLDVNGDPPPESENGSNCVSEIDKSIN
jgi:hypothetical protein